MEVPIELKTSFCYSSCIHACCQLSFLFFSFLFDSVSESGFVFWVVGDDHAAQEQHRRREKRGKAYRVIQHILITRIVIDVNGHASQSGDFGGEFGEEMIVLSKAKEYCKSRQLN